MKKSLQILFLSAFLLVQFKLNAQTVSITVAPPTTLIACHDSEYTVLVDSARATMAFGIYATLTSSGITKTNCDSVNLFPNVYLVLDTVIHGSLSGIITDTTLSPGIMWREYLHLFA